jgi:predicted phage terminase large subunit-like protein
MPHDLTLDARLASVMTDPRTALIAIEREMILRGGFKAFLRLAWHIIEPGTKFEANWHLDALCDHLEMVSKGEITRLAIAIPPRHSKSTVVSVMWPAWDWIANPQRRFLYASYNINLATRDNVRTRRVVESAWYRARFGDKFFIAGDQNTKQKFENSRTGSREVTSVGGSTTGLGADFICLDDPNNVLQAESAATRETTLTWWNEAMPSRLNDQQTGAFVVVQQRVNAKDVIGDILERSPGLYTYLCLPAEYDPAHPHVWAGDPRHEPGELLWPRKFTRASVDKLKISLGLYAAASQLQQLPAPREGGLFKEHWFVKIPAAHLPPDIEWVRGWDIAASVKTVMKADPDWTAGVKYGRSRSTGKFYIGHVVRVREEMHTVHALMLQTAEADGPNVKISIPQDPGAAGKALAQDMMRRLSKYMVSADPPTGDKIARATPVAGQAGVGNVMMVEAPWNADFIAEMIGFPTAAHDDQVDALSAAASRLHNTETGFIDYYAEMLAGQNQGQNPPPGFSRSTSTDENLDGLYSPRTP